MPDRLDVATHLLHVSAGRASADEPPGFATLTPPRKAARGRERDMLFLCLGLRARGPIPPELYAELIELAAAAFFGSPGSVTSALRQAMAAVNQRLLDINLRAGAGGAPVQGGLVGAVLRGADFYAVQCGTGTLIVARGLGLEKFPAAPGRPIGLSNSLDPHYFHTTVNESEYFCISQASPAGWSEVALAGLGSLSTLTAVGERLKETAGGDVAALVGRFELVGETSPQPARGVRGSLSSLLRSRAEPPSLPAEETKSEETPAPVEPEPAAATGTDWKELVRRSERLGESEPAPSIPVLEEMPPPPVARREPKLQRESPLSTLGAQITHGLRSIGRALSVTLSEANQALRKLAARALPEGTLQKEGLFVVPTSVQIGIAVLTPLVVVSIGVGLYLQNGRTQQFEDALNQARAWVAQARQAPDALAARPYWLGAVESLEQAESVRLGDPEVTALKQEAQAHLDELDWVTRLDFEPLVVGGLGRNVRVNHIELIGQDVYVLDKSSNRVLRLTPSANNTGHIVDRNFKCAGNSLVGEVAMGELLDIGVISGSDVIGDDAVVALDTTGALMYCTPGKEPLANVLLAPETSWVRPLALEVYAGRLYVLDPGTNQIWQFQDAGGAYTQPPVSYFTTAVYNLSDVIEFAIPIPSGQVFLLYRDGRVTICTRDGPGETAACQESAPFTDGRAGRGVGDRLADVTSPALLVYARPPEPSLYLLDADTAGIDQLSLLLDFVRQYRPLTPFLDPVTTVAVDQAKRVYVGAGDNVYVATPP